LTKTSKRLNIKLSTAKLILRKYRKTGELFNKNMGGKPKKMRTSRKDKVMEEESETCKRE
jgi:transposase